MKLLVYTFLLLFERRRFVFLFVVLPFRLLLRFRRGGETGNRFAIRFHHEVAIGLGDTS